MKKLIFSLFVLTIITNFSFGQTTVTNGAGSILLDAEEDSVGDNLIIQSTETNARTMIRLLPAGTDDRTFFEIRNSSDPINNGGLRLGARGSYGILSVANAGTPTTPLDNVAIELNPLNNGAAGEFVISTGGFLGSTFGNAETILAKVNSSGLSTIEAKVQATVAAPDYVFKKDYNLRSLEEVESFINQNSHLPEIPSAKEFERDGIVLGKMSFDLLKKVEELTLYMIDLKKENENLKKRVEQLEKK